MGHYVVARLMGFTTGSVSIELKDYMYGVQGSAAIVPARPLRSIDDVVDYLGRRVRVLYAGAIAETIETSNPNKQVDEEAAGKRFSDNDPEIANDHAKAREHLQLLRNLLYPDTDSHACAIQAELDAINDKLWQSTILLVQQHHKVIAGLASNLSSRVKRVKVEAVISAEELETLEAVKKLVPCDTAAL